MLTPRSEAEITSEWLLHVLQHYERRKTSDDEVTLHIIDFDINKSTNRGENYNSELINIVIKAKKHLKNEEEEKEITYNFMIKLQSTNLFLREMNRLCQSHAKELDIYSKIHPKFIEIQSELGESRYDLNIPEFIYGLNDGEDFVIVMRNLKSDGYILNDKKLGLNAHQLKLSVNQIARWHALSYVYNEKFNLVQEYPALTSGLKNNEFIFAVTEFALLAVYSLFKDRDDWKDFFLRLKNMKELFKKLRKNAIASSTKLPNSIYCLIHRDFWNNNFLFKYENEMQIQERHPVDISVIDWQMCHWNRAVIDLHYLLQTSTTYDVRKEHLDDILTEYYETFYEITKSYSTPITGLTFESFKRDFEESSIVGFCYGLCFTVATMSKVGEKMNSTSSPSGSVRGIPFVIKSKVAKAFTSLMLSSSMSFVLKSALKKMLGDMRKEIEEKSNEVMDTRLVGIIQEAIDSGTLNDISPVKS